MEPEGPDIAIWPMRARAFAPTPAAIISSSVEDGAVEKET